MSDIREFLDFKAIKARVTIADILPHYRVTLRRANNTTLKGNCPLPTHASGSKNTFFVNDVKSVWYCHSNSCRKNSGWSGGNVIDFVASMERCSPYEAAKKIEALFPAAAGSPIQLSEPNVSGDRRDGKELSTLPGNAQNRTLAFVLKDVNGSHPMIQERGISVATAEHFGVGYFPGKGSMAGRIVFPLYESDALVGYAGRTTFPVSDHNPKWLFGRGIKKSFLYGLDWCDPAKPIIICESLWAPLWFHEHGSQAASLMGSEMTVEQEHCLDPFPWITVALDNDVAGAEKSARICDRLKTNHRVSRARLVG